MDQQKKLDLGTRIELFTASRVQVYAGFVLGALLTVGGLGMAGCGLSQIPEIGEATTPKAKELATSQLVGGLLAGCVIALLGAVGVLVAYTLIGSGADVCENGLRQWPPGPKSAEVLWRDVDRIEERYIQDNVPLRLGGPLLSETYRQFAVICQDGQQFTFDRENIASVGRLGKRLRTIATAFSIPWIVVGKPK